MQPQFLQYVRRGHLLQEKINTVSIQPNETLAKKKWGMPPPLVTNAKVGLGAHDTASISPISDSAKSSAYDMDEIIGSKEVSGLHGRALPGTPIVVGLYRAEESGFSSSDFP